MFFNGGDIICLFPLGLLSASILIILTLIFMLQFITLSPCDFNLTPTTILILFLLYLYPLTRSATITHFFYPYPYSYPLPYSVSLRLCPVFTLCFYCNLFLLVCLSFLLLSFLLFLVSIPLHFYSFYNRPYIYPYTLQFISSLFSSISPSLLV